MTNEACSACDGFGEVSELDRGIPVTVPCPFCGEPETETDDAPRTWFDTVEEMEGIK